MHIAVIGMGRLREKYFRGAADEYIKRLSRFGKIEEIELNDIPEPSNASDEDRRKVKEREGEMILAKIKPADYVIAMCIDGKQWDSEDLSKHLQALEDAGRGRQVFVIGGSLGLADAVVARANEKLSMSKMTFPHQLARVMLLEQLYRCQKIGAGERYHK